jgi:hypothetical protein
MARKASTLATLDIVGEGLAQQDGLAERLARNRAATASVPSAPVPAAGRAGEGAAPAPDRAASHNAWRRGKALLQVAIPEDAHMELSILARRRRMTLSQLVKGALNQWLDSHGHALRLPD